MEIITAIQIIYKCLLCAGATYCYSFLLETPSKNRIICALIGGTGYAVYLLTEAPTGSPAMAAFAGALFISLISEISARLLKHTSTSFITVSVISLVPGMGFYKTMHYLVHNSYLDAYECFFSTMLVAGAIAIAIAVSAMLFRMYLKIALKVHFRSLL